MHKFHIRYKSYHATTIVIVIRRWRSSLTESKKRWAQIRAIGWRERSTCSTMAQNRRSPDLNLSSIGQKMEMINLLKSNSSKSITKVRDFISGEQIYIVIYSSIIFFSRASNKSHVQSSKPIGKIFFRQNQKIFPIALYQPIRNIFFRYNRDFPKKKLFSC